MTRVLVLSANLGDYDQQVPWVAQAAPPGTEVEVKRLTDADLRPRPKAMTPALQCGIPKMFGWELFPGYDVYIWVDASRGLLRPDTAAWFLEQLPRWADLALFRHPHRNTIAEEYEFVREKLAARSRYLTSRYEGEWLEGQYAATCHPGFRDRVLYASTAFMYRPTAAVTGMLAEWFRHKARYCLHDQLALPYLVWKHRLAPAVLAHDVYHCEHLPVTRPGRAARRRAS